VVFDQSKGKDAKCPVCGEMTTRPKYCSIKCSRKVANTLHEVKRRKKIDHVKVDSDITLKKLYERDHGVCYLCGEVCDWEDKEEKGGVVVCGNRYPSIDHVVPLARGGEHSWENVRLAHRICNTRKGAKHQKIASLLTTKE
jgi:5-methylcytosine-specific restriction endonuclease McrA